MLEKLEKYLSTLFENMGYIEYFKISESNKKDICDYQINSVFKIAKEKNLDINTLGLELENKIKEMPEYNNYLKKVEFSHGFLNLTVSDKLLNDSLNDSLNCNLGIKKLENKETYFLDYGGPNVAKPLHIGHLRPAIIGESIKRILNYKGYNTISDVHLGDFGLQMGQVIKGIELDNKNIDEIDINYLNEVYPRLSALCKTDETIYNQCKEIVTKLQNQDEKYTKIWNKIYEISIKDIKRLYDYLDINFDLWLGESDSKPYIPKLIELLEEKELLKTDEGAKVVFLKEETDKKEMPPIIVETKDNGYVYATTDLASIVERKEKYNPDYILYVVDKRQSLHFEQVFRTIKKMNYNTCLEHIAFGTINGSDNKPFKTRSGETLKLDTLIELTKKTFIEKREENINMKESDLDKIVNAIIKFADLYNNREKNYIFDINKFSDVSGKTGPYILYTALRIKKILDINKTTTDTLSDNIYNETHRNLALKILEFDKYLTRSCNDRLPSLIAEYVYDLSNSTSSFYQNNNVSNEENITKKNDYINILTLSYNIIVECLNLLGISIPSKM